MIEGFRGDWFSWLPRTRVRGKFMRFLAKSVDELPEIPGWSIYHIHSVPSEISGDVMWCVYRQED